MLELCLANKKTFISISLINHLFSMKYLYIVICVLFIISVLLQQKSAGLGSLMGQESGDEVAQTRRGAEVFLHRASIVLATLFIGVGLLVMAGLIQF